MEMHDIAPAPLPVAGVPDVGEAYCFEAHIPEYAFDALADLLDAQGYREIDAEECAEPEVTDHPDSPAGINRAELVTKAVRAGIVAPNEPLPWLRVTAAFDPDAETRASAALERHFAAVLRDPAVARPAGGPPIPEDATPIATVAAQALADGLTLVRHAALANNDRQNLWGIHARVASGRLTLTATDGHRVAQAVVPSIATAREGEGFLRLSEVKPLVSALKEIHGDVGLWLTSPEQNNRFVAWGPDDAVLVNSTLLGRFPNVEPVIPKEYERVVGLDRDAMMAALRQAARTCPEKIKPVKLMVKANPTPDTPGEIRIETERAEYGDLLVRFPCYAERGAAIGLNAKYLLDALWTLPPGVVLLGLSGALQPVGLASPALPDHTLVIIPLKIEW